MNIEPIPLQEPLTIDNIVNGKTQIPEDVKTFFTMLHTKGSNEVSQRKTRLINLFAEDAVHSAFEGKLLPCKHISVGLSLRSMTGSKTVGDVLSQFSHCVSDKKS